MIKETKILYFLKSGREFRVRQESPDEFLYGFNYLKKLKLDVSLLTETDIGITTKSGHKISSLLNMIIYWLFGIPGRSLFNLFLKRKIFDNYDIILVTTNSFGLSLAFLKKLHLFKPNIIYISMGLVNKKTPTLWRFVYKKILKNCLVLTLSEYDAKVLEKTLKIEVDYINFGVDKNFWFNKHKNEPQNYVLTIGNDKNRDYKTLLKAWKNDFPLLKIITNQKIKSNKKNIEIIFGDWYSAVLSDKEIRKLIIDSIFVVLPIKDTVQPSGQSVCLQSMACGKTVLITNFRGLWNKNIMKHNNTCYLTGRPGDEKKLEESVKTIIVQKTLLKEIGLNARAVIENNLNSNKMGKQIYNKINKFITNE